MFFNRKSNKNNNQKFNGLIILLFRLILLNSFILSSPVIPEVNLEGKNQNLLDSEYLRPLKKNDFYILGPGDSFQIMV